MKVLITGGFGFLGGRVAQYLSDQGHTVLLGSRKAIASPPWLSKSKVVETRWNSPDDLERLCSGIDAVIHTAGMNAQDCANDPVGALECNGIATANLVRAAIRTGVKRFIYLSTAHVYSSPLAGTITEDTCPMNLHPYATSHRAGEDAILFAQQRGEIEGIVIRLSNAFGTPTHKEVNCWMLLVNDLCRQAVTTGKMILHSTGMQRRDFIALTDACRAIDHLLSLAAGSIGKGLFNLGGAWTPTVWEMACLIQQRCASSIGIQPELFRVNPVDSEPIMELHYHMDRFLKTGFQPAADRFSEIDQLLIFSRASFT